MRTNDVLVKSSIPYQFGYSSSVKKRALTEVRTLLSVKKGARTDVRKLSSLETTWQRSERQELVATPTVPEAEKSGCWRKNAATLREEAPAMVLHTASLGHDVGAGLLSVIMIAVTVQAARPTLRGARRLGLKLWTFPPGIGYGQYDIAGPG